MINHFNVLEPPTSQQFIEVAYSMMSQGGILAMVIKEESKTAMSLEFRLNQIQKSEDGGQIFSGRSQADSSWVEVRTQPNMIAPARGVIYSNEINEI